MVEDSWYEGESSQFRTWKYDKERNVNLLVVSQHRDFRGLDERLPHGSTRVARVAEGTMTSCGLSEKIHQPSPIRWREFAAEKRVMARFWID